jgi:hypothetical protein
VTKGPQIAPAFPSSVLHGAKVVVPNWAYFLLRGSISDFGDWGAADMWSGEPRHDMPDPAFTWPADHAWCVANDVDPHWAGIGAASSAIDQLLADPLLDVVPADPPPRPAVLPVATNALDLCPDDGFQVLGQPLMNSKTAATVTRTSASGRATSKRFTLINKVGRDWRRGHTP